MGAVDQRLFGLSAESNPHRDSESVGQFHPENKVIGRAKQFYSNMEVATSCLAPNRPKIQRYRNIFIQGTLLLLYNTNKY